MYKSSRRRNSASPALKRLFLIVAGLCLTLHGERPAARPSQPKSPPRVRYSWRSVPIIGGGFVDGIVADPAQKGLFYARTDIGGAYRWNAAGRRWIPLTDWIGRKDANLTGIESIGVDPADPQRLYLAAGTYTESWSTNGAILVSSNQGRSFTTVPLPIKIGGNDNGRLAGERLAVDPNDGRIVFFGSRDNGLWKSSDFGAHWHPVASFPVHGATAGQGVGVIFEDFLKSSGRPGRPTPVLYAGVSDTGSGAGHAFGLYESRDAGASWQPVPHQPTGLYPNHGVLAADGVLYLTYGNGVGPNGVTSGAVWKLNTGSGLWTEITPASEGNARFPFGYGAVAVDARHPGTVMVSTLDRWNPGDNLARSTDGGATWTLLQAGHDRFDDALSPYLNWGQPAPKLGWWLGALMIDPFDSGHVLYGTGATIWVSHDVTRADAGEPTHWSVGARGIEETVALQLISPPAGPAHLLSGLGDIGGFTHTSFARSPAAGMMRHPIFGNTTGLDFAQRHPLRMARAGTSGHHQFGAWSADGGLTWTPFRRQPDTRRGAGSIAISAGGGILVWAPEDAPISFSTDNGASWTASTGTPAQPRHALVLADRVQSKTFYLFDANSGTLYRSRDGGASFAPAASGLPARGALSVSPADAGDLWLATPGGLLHSTDTGATFSPVPGVQSAYGVGFGRAAAGAGYPTLYLGGTIAGVNGVFRSTDAGVHWLRINDGRHQYGYIRIVAGDPRIFGRVYLGTSGRGILIGDPRKQPVPDAQRPTAPTGS